MRHLLLMVCLMVADEEDDAEIARRLQTVLVNDKAWQDVGVTGVYVEQLPDD